MALLLIRTSDTCDYVHSDDPAVSLPTGDDDTAIGWVPAQTAKHGKSATTITIRPLNGFEHLECQALAISGEGIADQIPMIRAVLSRGLVAVDGSADLAAAFIDSPTSAHLLGVFTLIMEAGAAAPFPGPVSGSATG